MKWTFGIITDGSEEKRVLSIIDSIRQQGIPTGDYEILIVGGNPIESPDIHHIPFDDSNKKGWITRKKNLIARHAKFEHISIGHDYISYRPNWYKNFLEFGSNWNVCMTRIENMDCIRYRDWIESGPAFVSYGDHSRKSNMYISGTYFCIKREFFVNYLFDEELVWGKGEDVEWSNKIKHGWNYSINPRSIVRFLKYKEQCPISPEAQNEMEYKNLIDTINSESEIKVDFRDRSVGMRNHCHPLSLTNSEFNFVTNFVKANNLKRGYEVATAFGFSALSAGLGFKETGGKLVTMDAYIEEQYNNCGHYVGKKDTYKDADGFKLASYLVNKFELPVHLEVGWSPDDTASVISKHFDLSTEKLDYVFIDAGHWHDAIRSDINSVLPHLADKYVIFFHDIYCFDNNLMDYVYKNLGQRPTEPFPRNDAGNYGLAYISNL